MTIRAWLDFEDRLFISQASKFLPRNARVEYHHSPPALLIHTPGFFKVTLWLDKWHIEDLLELLGWFMPFDPPEALLVFAADVSRTYPDASVINRGHAGASHAYLTFSFCNCNAEWGVTYEAIAVRLPQGGKRL